MASGCPACNRFRKILLLGTLYRRIAEKQLDATVLDATLPDIDLPVRIAWLEHRHGGGTAVGMAAHPDAMVAHRKALIEALHTLNWLHQIQPKRPQATAEGATATLADFADHVFFYGHTWASANLEHWRHGPRTTEQRTPLATVAEPFLQVDHLVELLKGIGLNVLTIDVTSSDIAEAGFCVVRTVVPGMTPLVPGGVPCTGGSRLRTIGPQLRWPAQFGPDGRNPHPHPFP